MDPVWKILAPAGVPHFVTCTTINWLPLFSTPALAGIVLDALRHLHETGRLTLHAYVIMENHLHLMVSAPDVSHTIGNFKSFTARRIIDWLELNGRRDALDQEHQVWQEGFHPELILGDTMLTQKLNYLHYNPVRRGYVNDPAHWRYSSCKDYEGGKGLLPVVLVGG